jgi:hypothetical protein
LANKYTILLVEVDDFVKRFIFNVRPGGSVNLYKTL